MTNIKVSRTKNEICELNEKFHSKELLSQDFYIQLDRKGIVLASSVLVYLIPDGDNTYLGKIIRQDGDIVAFDLDLDDEKYSEWKNVTEEFLNEFRVKSKNQPWLESIVAYEYFKSINTGYVIR